jgi:CheY-like chemotaxis protein
LGLPLTKKLAELLHGSVSMESKLGEGSTFSVTLPLSYSSEMAVPPAESARKVLIIDDEEIARYLIRQALGAPEAVVIEAADGIQGLAKARKELPQAIFLDLRMPELNGFEVLRQLKANPATRHIPVVIITSKALSSQERAALQQSGALEVLSKEVLSSPDGARQCRAVLEVAGLRIDRAPAPGSMLVSK